MDASSPPVGYSIGIDTGGTFTDLVAYNLATGVLSTFKTPSIPSRPGQALIDAISGSLIPFDEIESLVHGTTVATNALIERTGARVGLLVSQGHEDVLYIQRINRQTLYDLRWQKPKPLLEQRGDSLGIPERIGSHGQEIVPLDIGAVTDLCRSLKSRNVEAVAICLLFAYVNPEHERLVKEIVERELPNLPISVSHEVAPIWREYERASTTVADAYLKPLMSRYVGSLTESLRSAGLTSNWTILKSNGGAMRSAAAAENPIQTAQSGPSGGMLAAAALGIQAGEPDLLTLDMGGTSADVALILKGEQRHTTEYEIEWGIPAAIPLIDIKSIGAGGGSIAWIAPGGFLRVGPQSAGAAPGPACYRQGGTKPTVTDANLVLGRLDAGYFLGGRMTLDLEAAQSSLSDMAIEMGMDIVDLASAIVEIANENMASAIKMVSIEQGYDPRRFALFAFGGAGPLHAAAVARALRIPRILIPMFPGNASALGMLIADLRVDKVWTQAFRSNAVDSDLVAMQFGRIRDAAIAELRSEGFEGAPEIAYSISMRYLGQNYEHEVPIASDAITPERLVETYVTFAAVHDARYGYAIANEIIELVAFKVTAAGKRPAPRLSISAVEASSGDKPDRQVHFRGRGFLTAKIFRRYELPAGTVAEGPCLLEEPGSTTLIEPGMRGIVLEDGQLLIETEVGK